MIDAEVVVVNENGRGAFNALQHKRPGGHIQLYAFDILVHCGEMFCAYRLSAVASC